MRVRTYGFPGLFNEANPESSARHIETVSSTSKLVRPQFHAFLILAVAASQCRLRRSASPPTAREVPGR